jgi:histidyl-tRNA synthetase
VSTGSPRKRFDKAAKLPSHTLISLSVADGTPSMRIRGEGSDIAARVEAFIVAAN